MTLTNKIGWKLQALKAQSLIAWLIPMVLLGNMGAIKDGTQCDAQTSSVLLTQASKKLNANYQAIQIDRCP